MGAQNLGYKYTYRIALLWYLYVNTILHIYTSSTYMPIIALVTTK